jgi:hypothetical protein
MGENGHCADGEVNQKLVKEGLTRFSERQIDYDQ